MTTSPHPGDDTLQRLLRGTRWTYVQGPGGLGRETWSTDWSTAPTGDSTRATGTPDEVVARGTLDNLVRGRFLLGESLGAGGFGVVRHARDLLYDRDVAVKLVAAFAPPEIERVRRELAALRWAQLPGVVRLYDDGFHDQVYFIAMERVDGPPFLVSEVRWTEVAQEVRQLLRTLSLMHARKLVHGDLKPSNILLDEARGPVVLDFGVASGGALAGIDGRGRGWSRHYAAPEQVRGERPTAASDLYTVGLMLHEALSGIAAPRPDEDGCRDFEPLARVAGAIPPAVARTVDALLAHDPEDRPPTASAVLSALGDALPGPLVGVLRSLPETGEVPDEASLQSLFHGPERFFHLPSRGARELWARTRGDVEAIRDELDAWLRGGLARWEDGRCRVDDTALSRLQSGWRARRPRDLSDLPEARRRLLRQATALVEEGPTEDRVARFLDSLPRDWVDLTERDLEGLLARVIEACRHHALPVAVWEALLEALVLATLNSSVDGRFRFALYHLECHHPWTPRIEALWSLLQATWAIGEGQSLTARRIAERLEPFDHPQLERARVAALLFGGLHQNQDDATTSFSDWAGDDPHRQALLWRARATWLVHQGRSTEAAEATAHALGLLEQVDYRGPARISALAGRGQAYLYDGRVEEARRDIQEAYRMAAAGGQRDEEARVWMSLRILAYMAGDPGPPDLEAVQAVRWWGNSYLFGLLVVEAAVAWRQGDTARAARWAAEAVGPLRATGQRAAAALALGLQARVEEDRRVAARALEELGDRTSPPGMVVQVLALAASQRPDARPALAERARPLMPRLGGFPPGLRREVLSMVEVARWLGLPCPGAAPADG